MAEPQNPRPGVPEAIEAAPAIRRRGSLLRTAAAVFWSFFGIRKRAEYDEDAAKLNPVHVILMGILGAILFVLTLLLVVRTVLHFAVH